MIAPALAPAPASRPDPRFLDALRTRIEPVPLPFTYKAALAVVALAMVLLPLLYVALVGLAGWGVVWYALNGLRILADVSSIRLRLFAYATPLLVGGTVVLFLIKPLFARRQHTDDEVPLDPSDEPLLFEFVRRTAIAVGAPVPREIRLDHDVNASASLRRGLFSDDLVLTLGVPLAAGLTLEQLAGILAHEFGHFGQRAGMRLSYIVRSVNYWFARVVYERDGFDARLEEHLKDEDLRVRAIAGIAAALVWIGRTILKGLMYLGHVISSSLLRQMEFDADRYCVGLVGREVHASVLRDVFVLSQVHNFSLSGIREQYRQRTLPDSLAAVMSAHRQRFAKTLDSAYKEHLTEGRTHLFDTHPTDRERVTKSLSGPAEGTFSSNLPASVLFRDFASLERSVSREVFQNVLGMAVPDDLLVPAEQVVAVMEERGRDAEAAERYLPGGVSVLHPLPLPGALLPPPADPRQALSQAIAAVEAGRKNTAALLERATEVYDKRTEAWLAETLLSLNIPIDGSSFGLQRDDQEAAREVQEWATPQLDDLSRRLAPLQAGVAHRLATALSLLHLPEAAGHLEEGATASPRQAKRFLEAASRLREVLPLLLQLQSTRRLLVMIGGREDSEGTLVSPLAQLAGQGRTQLSDLLKALEGVIDPFPDEPIPLTRLAAPDGLPPAEPGPVYHAVCATGVLLELYERILGRLCRMAEGVEGAAGRP